MKKTDCRLCKSKDLVMFLDLGHHPHSDQFRKDKEGEEVTYPLRLVQCQECQFVQLDYVVSPETLYTEDYLYESSITGTAGKHWTEFAKSVIKKIGLKKESLVLDIGSNDGTLLQKFKAEGMHVLGIDPCPEVAKIANDNLIPTLCEFFGDSKMGGTAELITGSNVFAHIDDLDKVMSDVKDRLSENGVFVFESPYLGNFIEEVQYDTVYHQHLSYLAVAPLVTFLKKHGMEIFDIEFTDIHGGCFRCYISRKGEREVQTVVKAIAENEDFNIEVMREFAGKARQHRWDLIQAVHKYALQGRRIIAVSSPAKGMTLLNYTGVGRYLDFATDKSKLKQGRYTPGTHLEIKSDKDLNGDEVGLLLAWNFADEIIKNVPQIKEWIIPTNPIREI